jgi:hypothetical protein
MPAPPQPDDHQSDQEDHREPCAYVSIHLFSHVFDKLPVGAAVALSAPALEPGADLPLRSPLFWFVIHPPG